jgi:DedD protein
MIIVAVLAVVTLVFVLGVSVGKQWERKTEETIKGQLAKAEAARPKPSPPAEVPAAPPVSAPVLRPATTTAAEKKAARDEAKTEPEDLTFPKVLTSNSKKTAPLAKEAPPKTKKAAEPKEEEAAGARFTVQVGAYKTRSAAQASAERLKKKGYEARVYDSGAQGGPYHFKLRVGRYASKETAKSVARKLKYEKFTPFVTKEEQGND